MRCGVNGDTADRVDGQYAHGCSSRPSRESEDIQPVRDPCGGGALSFAGLAAMRLPPYERRCNDSPWSHLVLAELKKTLKSR